MTQQGLTVPAHLTMIIHFPMLPTALQASLAIVASLLMSTALHGQSTGRPSQPNIVLILTDDLGWQDVGCYDIDEPCPYETPNIDRLATQGILFWNGYSPAPTCAPSRCAILSGKHPARAQKTHVVGGEPPHARDPRHLMITPWYSGRMAMSEVTIAEALKTNGYRTGCIGKWHCAIDHHAFPQPSDQGFDESTMERGATSARQNRLKEFSTTDPSDPYQLDANGFPKHQNTIDAIKFIENNKAKPFFLYHANWLVHAPIHTRSEVLLRKYCEKMGVEYPTDPGNWDLPGQKNPYYGAMVEALDYYTGQVLETLEQEDPRWPGHKLSENTYVIFTSDNGGMLGHPGETYTSNAPLDKGKINAREGGVRVPLIIRGPGIAEGKQTDALANGLDFYPTILTWTNTKNLEKQHLDGCDLSGFLGSSDLNSSLITHPDGTVRDTMVWHFPHGPMQSSIRRGNYKLIRNWNELLVNKDATPELYRLYKDDGSRGDLEEANNLAATHPELTKELNQILDDRLSEMDASFPMLNPKKSSKPAGWDGAPTPTKHSVSDRHAVLTYQNNGSKVVKAHLVYSLNGGKRYEEWFRNDAEIIADKHKVRALIPEGATHYFFNLIDENHFFVGYPTITRSKDHKNFADYAIPAAPTTK